MKRIKGPIFTHLSFEKENTVRNIVNKYRDLERKASSAIANQVGNDDGFLIENFGELVERVAQVAYENNGLILVYRGQTEDYRVNKKGRSSLYPSIFREKWKQHPINNDSRKEYFSRLSKLCKLMKEKIFKDENDVDSESDGNFNYYAKNRNYNEQMWSIIQHYEIFPTPMIDVTQSLQVACSFALSDDNKDHGYIYVIGLPSIGGSVSYYIEDEISVARLQTVCPPKAIRAHFQEGLLVTKFPFTSRKSDGLNLSNRMLAKFKIEKNNFWDNGFHQMTIDTLIPKNDPFAKEIAEIQNEVYPDLYAGL